MNHPITIDPVFQNLIPKLSEEQIKGLEDQVVKEGCRDSLIVWKKGNALILIDGHHRHRICTEHNIPFNVIEMEFEDAEAVKIWMKRNAINRRNLNPDILSLYRGEIYNYEKKQGKRTDLTSCQIVTKLDSSEAVGEEFGVSPRTIKRDGKYAEAVETLKTVQPDLKKRIDTGKAPSKSSVIKAARIAKVSPDEARELLKKSKGEKMALYRQAAEKIKNGMSAALGDNQHELICAACLDAQARLQRAAKQTDLTKASEEDFRRMLSALRELQDVIAENVAAIEQNME